MSRLSGIPVRIEPRNPEASMATIGGGVKAIVAEIASLLERVAGGGDSSAIDLRSLPMSSADRDQLFGLLGPGEVTITLQAGGESTIRETSVHGVWWSDHRDRSGEVIASFIEVARVPAILVVDLDELKRGAQQLRSGIAASVESDKR